LFRLNNGGVLQFCEPIFQTVGDFGQLTMFEADDLPSLPRQFRTTPFDFNIFNVSPDGLGHKLQIVFKLTAVIIDDFIRQIPDLKEEVAVGAVAAGGYFDIEIPKVVFFQIGGKGPATLGRTFHQTLQNVDIDHHQDVIGRLLPSSVITTAAIVEGLTAVQMILKLLEGQGLQMFEGRKLALKLLFNLVGLIRPRNFDFVVQGIDPLGAKVVFTDQGLEPLLGFCPNLPVLLTIFLIGTIDTHVLCVRAALFFVGGGCPFSFLLDDFYHFSFFAPNFQFQTEIWQPTSMLNDVGGCCLTCGSCYQRFHG